jgi:single-strand DNA-binding protein
MARDLNKVMLTGRLGKNVDLRVTPNGRAVATFSVASGRNYKDGDNWKEQTEWFRVVAWEKLAETCANKLKKGSHVFIEGRIQTREWQDKEGQKKTSTEVIATDMYLLDSKPKGGSANEWEEERPARKPTYQGNPFEDDIAPEDIPF